MSLYVGCSDASGAIYDLQSKDTREIIFNKGSGKCLNVLEDHSVALTDIQEMVITRSYRYIGPFSSSKGRAGELPRFIEESRLRGVQQVHLINVMSVSLQTFVNAKSITFAEGQQFFYSAGHVNTLWRHENGKLIFLQSVPDCYAVDFMESVRKLIREKEIRQWLCCVTAMKPEQAQVIKQEFCEIEFIKQYLNFTSQEIAKTALWMVKRMNGIKSGLSAQNFIEVGLKIFFDGNCVLDNSKNGLPLPFEWTSDWGVKAQTFRVCFHNFEEQLELPQDKELRVSLKVDSNGAAKLDFEEWKETIGILLQFDSLYITKKCSTEVETTVLGPFDTNVRFDKSPPEATDSINNEDVVKHSIEMLDINSELKEGWKRCDSKNVIFVSSQELISASKVVEHLFRHVLAQIETEGRMKVVLAVPTEFTENQRVGLEQAAKQICDEVVLLSEADTLTFGIAKEHNLLDGDLLLTVDLSMNGCTCTLVKVVSDSKCIHLAKETDTDLLSENVRQNQRAWIERMQKTAHPPTHTPELEAEVKRIQNSSYTVNSVNEVALNCLRQLIDSTMKDQSVFDVKIIMLLGDCRTIPVLNNLLYWKFSNAHVITPTAQSIRQIVAQGLSCI